MARFASARTSLYAWVGLLALAQATSMGTGRPEVVWPAAVGLGFLVAAVGRLVIEIARDLPEVASSPHPRAQKPPQVAQIQPRRSA